MPQRTKSWTRLRRWPLMRRLPVLLLVACAYYLGARIGLRLAFANRNVTPLWPPTGIALAALCVWGPGLWPAIAAGAVAANLSNGASIATALAICVGNTLAPVLAWFLLCRVAGFDRRLRRVSDVARLFVVGGSSTVVSASLGLAALAFTHALGPSPGYVWLVWWLGDASGVVLFAPLILTSAERGAAAKGWLAWPTRTSAWLLLTAAVAVVAFTSPVPMTFLPIPALVWGALVFRQQGVALANILVAVVATWATTAGLGPYHQFSTTTRLLLLQAFNVTLALLSLIVAAVGEERMEAHRVLQSAAADFARQALQDTLTKLANRALLVDRLRHALAPRTGPRVTILFMDLDDFKWVNDSLGHAAGDALLIGVAQRLLWCVRPCDTVARMGGDEFAVLLESTDIGDGMAVAERIIASLRAPFALLGAEVSIGASVGIAAAGADSCVDDLIRNADLAMYRAKGRSKGSFELYEPSMTAEAQARHETKADLSAALSQQAFDIHYQPIVALRSGEVIGAEALVRWVHPRLGVLQPSQFVPSAEQTGLIVPLGRWVLERACAQACAWQRSSPTAMPLVMSVNVSAQQLQNRSAVLDMLDIIAASGLDAQCLVLEITESGLVADALPALARFRTIGVRIAIDDFGTGYSSLSRLRELPIEMVKVDKTFIADDDPALTIAILRFLETIHVDTVVEGIERPDQLHRLLIAGCLLGQGFLFSRPLDAEAFGRAYAPPGGFGKRRRAVA